jgi:hypothetical protein
VISPDQNRCDWCDTPMLKLGFGWSEGFRVGNRIPKPFAWERYI